MKKRAIKVPLDSWIYLINIQSMQRGGHNISEHYKEHLTKEMERSYNKDGHLLIDGSLGGAIGKPENSYEEHRWTDWSIDQMISMLDEVGLSYREVEPVDCIEVNL